MENYWAEVEEKKCDCYEITITKDFWVGSEIWNPGLIVTTFFPPLEKENCVIVYVENLCVNLRIPLTHCKVRKFIFVTKITKEHYWEHWQEDGILPPEEINMKEVGTWD